MKFIMWSKPNCKYCDMSKLLILNKGFSVQVKTIGRGYTIEDLLKEFPEARTVPIISTDTGEYIGGYNELNKYLENNKC